MNEETNSLAERETNTFIGSDSLRIRLDTKEILDRIKVFLQGNYLQPNINEEAGTITYDVISIGEAKANQRGLQSIMFWLESKLNAHIVQGNITTKQYANFLKRSRSELAVDLMNNRINYGISKSDYQEIINNLMSSLELFISRAINAGDRKAITASSEHREIHSTSDKGKRFGIF